MCNKITFLDELKTVSPEHKLQMESFIFQRPTLGKSKVVKKALKKLNKRRKRAGLGKIKQVKLKVPKSWDLFDLTGFQKPK